jgi:hypothetical protein
MSSEYSRIWPLLIAALAVLMIYRRFRRSFGRQLLRPRRMTLRMCILIALGVSLIPLALGSGEFLVAEITGGAAGVALALWGARRTRYVRHNGQLHYVPHTYTGIAVSLLVLGRIVYRFVQLYSMGQLAGLGNTGSAPGSAPAAMVRSPVTVGLFFVLIGYYVCYYSCVLWKSKHITAADIEAPYTAAVPSADAVTPSSDGSG